MRSFSLWSILFMIFGLAALFINNSAAEIIAPLAGVGFLCLFLGIIASLIAILKKETSKMKELSIIAFFVILLAVVWFQPLLFIFVLSWLKSAL